MAKHILRGFPWSFASLTCFLGGFWQFCAIALSFHPAHSRLWWTTTIRGLHWPGFHWCYVHSSNKLPMVCWRVWSWLEKPLLRLEQMFAGENLKRLECSALELLILSAPCSNQPQRAQQQLLFGHGNSWKWLFTVISLGLTGKQEHRMVFKYTLWLKAWKQLASGQAVRMNNDILGQRRRRAQILPAIIWLFWMYLNGEVVN